jgi:hypothetical protein
LEGLDRFHFYNAFIGITTSIKCDTNENNMLEDSAINLRDQEQAGAGLSAS